MKLSRCFLVVRLLTFSLASLGLLTSLDAQVPGIISYQGRVAVGGTNFDGTGQFQFALLAVTNTAATATARASVSSGFITSYTVTAGGSGYTVAPAVIISDPTGSGASATAQVGAGAVTNIVVVNPGTGYSATPTVAIAPPPAQLIATTVWSNGVNAVSLAVTKGLYSVLLGDTTVPNMTSSIPAPVFTNADVRLRVWFNDGVNGLQLLSPDQRLASVGYAMLAGNVPDGAITSAKLAAGAVSNPKLANSSVTVTAGTGLAGGGTVPLGGSVTLSNAGVLGVTGTGNIASSSGQNPQISFTGTLPTGNGGTGIGTPPAAAGQYLRSSGAGTWAVGTVQAGDLPSLSAAYVDRSSAQTIAGAKTFSNIITGNVSGTAAGFTGALAGDVTGSQAATKVAKINGSELGSLAGATNGQVLTYSGSNWVAKTLPALGTGSVSSVQLANGAVTTAKLAAGAVGSNQLAAAGINNANLAHNSVTVAAGTGLAGGGVVPLGGAVTLSNAGVLGVTGSGNIAASGGQNPQLSFTGTLPTASGGTGLNAAPSDVGQYLRSNGTGTWAIATVQAGDIPSLSATYVDRTSAQTIAGAKTFSNTITGNVSGTAAGFTGPLGGDVTGSQAASKVSKINGSVLGSLAGTTNGQVLTYSGSNWVAKTLPALGTGSVTSVQLANNAVTTANLAAGAVTAAKIANGAVGSSQLANNAVTAANIAAGAVGNAAFAAGSVTGDKIQAGAITDANISPSANIDAGKIVGGDLQAARLKVGSGHTLGGSLATIAGGQSNIASGDGSSVGGGSYNGARDLYATVGGGIANTAAVSRATVSGGAMNLANGPDSAIGGGSWNTAGDQGTTVGGGRHNTASGFYATVAGGLTNTASGSGAVVSGGGLNSANNNYSTIAGGWQNTASNLYAMVPGGAQNVAGGQYSFAAGQQAKANHDGGFVWADATGADFASTAANQFLIRAMGGVGIGTNQTAGAMLTVAGTAALSGNLALPATTGPAVGVISIGGTPFLYSYGGGTFVGPSAGNFTMSGLFNTAVGKDALSANTDGTDNTAIGSEALQANTSGQVNTAIGAGALFANTTGSQNTATGEQALQNNTSGSFNTANGILALASNTNGYENTATGAEALYANTTGSQNTATGGGALQNNTTGSDNTANGAVALSDNTTGNENTGIGYFALYSNTNGIRNTAIGSGALSANASGSYNIAIGADAGGGSGANITNGDNNIIIGNHGLAGDNAIIRIGTPGIQSSTYLAGISGVTISPAGAAVFVNSNGQLGTVNSSQRFKEDIRDMGDQSDVLLSLRPVAFRYKHEIDPQGLPQFGLIAEEVEIVAPGLVLRDAQGVVYTVRYEQINAMLLNEFLKQHRQQQEQQRVIHEQQQQIQLLTEQMTVALQQNPQPNRNDQQAQLEVLQRQNALLTKAVSELQTQVWRVSEKIDASSSSSLQAVSFAPPIGK